MAYKKRNFRRKPVKRFAKKRFTGRKKNSGIPRSLTPKVMSFKRDYEETIPLTNIPPEGWTANGNAYYKQFNYALSSLNNITDFQNLFKQYRLKGVRVKMYFSNTVSGTEDASSHANSQILIRMAPNQGGLTRTIDQAFWTETQAKKYRTAINGGRPIDIYMPLKQLNEISSSAGGTATTMTSPKYITTTVDNVIHAGLNIQLERVDAQNFTTGFNNNQLVKFIHTIYFQMRGVE